MFVGYLQEFIHAIEEAGSVLLPGKVVEEDAHRIHAQAFGPTEFAVDCGKVKGVGLPHFEFVDGSAGDKVAADEPGLFGVPRIGPLG